MESVTTVEAKSRFSQLLERVLQGEEFVITEREKPVARLVPEGRANVKAARRAVARLEALRRRIATRTAGHPKLTLSDFRSAVEEGRR